MELDQQAIFEEYFEDIQNHLNERKENFEELMEKLCKRDLLDKAEKDNLMNIYEKNSNEGVCQLKIVLETKSMKDTLLAFQQLVIRHDNKEEDYKEDKNQTFKIDKKHWQDLIELAKKNRLKDFSKITILPFPNCPLTSINNIFTNIEVCQENRFSDPNHSDNDKNKNKPTITNINYKVFWKYLEKTKKFNKIIFSGEPLIGKTVHVKYLLFNWARKNLINFEDKLVLVLFLKDVDPINNFYEEIKIQNFERDDHVTSQFLKFLFRGYSDKIILFLDGADEFNFEDHSINCYISDGQCNISTVAWCRRWKASELKIQCSPYVVLQLRGLKDELSEEFIKTQFNNDKADKYLNFFNKVLKRDNENRKLIELCKSPFFLRIIPLIFADRKNLHGVNLFTIYDYIVQLVVQFNINDSDQRVTAKKYLEEHFSEICFSYSGNQKILFENQTKDYKNIIAYLKGLVQSHFNPFTKKYEIKFFHNSFKNFFAAKFLLISSKKENNVKRLLGFQKDNNVFHIMNFVRERSIVDYESFMKICILLRCWFYCNEKILEEINSYDYTSDARFRKQVFPNTIIKILIQTRGFFWKMLTFENCLLNSLRTKEYLIQYCTENLTYLCIRDAKSVSDDGKINKEFLDHLDYFMIKRLDYLEYSTVYYKILIISDHFQREAIFSSEKITVIHHQEKVIVFLSYTISASYEFLVIEIFKKNHNFDLTTFIRKFSKLKELTIKNWYLDEKVNRLLFQSTIETGRSDALKIYLRDCLLINIDNNFFRNCSKMISCTTDSGKNTLSIVRDNGDSYQIFLNLSCKQKTPLSSLTSEQISFHGILQGLENNFVSIENLDVSTYNLIIDSEKSYFFKIILHFLKNSSEIDVFKFGAKFSSVQLTELAKELSFKEHPFQRIVCQYPLQFVCENNQQMKLLEIFSSDSSYLKDITDVVFERVNINNLEIYTKFFSSLHCKVQRIKFKKCMFDYDTLEEILSMESFDKVKKVEFNICYLDDERCKILESFLMKNLELKKIDFGQNNGTSYIGFSRILNGLRNSLDYLTSINFSNCNLSEEQSFNFGQILEILTHLQDFDISFNCNMGNGGFRKICEGLIKSSKSLNKLLLQGCNLSCLQGKQLGKLLNSCQKLVDINLKFNPNMDHGLTDICEGLRTSGKILKNLNLASCNLNIDKNQSLKNLLGECSSLENIDLSLNSKGLDVILIKNLRKSDKTLRMLNFIGCQLTGKDFLAILSILKSSPTIQQLYLGLNLNMDLNFKIIKSQGQSMNFNFQKLDFHGCNLKDWKFLEDFLKASICLKEINFSWNFFNASTLKKICSGLSSSLNSIEKINFSNCKLTSEHGEILGGFLERCLLLKDIDFSFNENMDSGFKYIFQSLEFSSSFLRILNLSKSNLDYFCCKKLGNLLRKCSLEQINLNSCKLADDGAQTVISGLQYSRSTLNCLSIADCNLNKENGLILGSLLENFSCLKVFNVSFNSCLGKSIVSIIAGLRMSIRSLTNLDFRQISFTEAEREELNNLLKDCTSLQQVHLSKDPNLKLFNLQLFPENYSKYEFFYFDQQDTTRTNSNLICSICSKCWMNDKSETYEHLHTICVDCIDDVLLFNPDKISLISNNNRMRLSKKISRNFQKVYFKAFFKDLENEISKISTEFERYLCPLCLLLDKYDVAPFKSNQDMDDEEDDEEENKPDTTENMDHSTTQGCPNPFSASTKIALPPLPVQKIPNDSEFEELKVYKNSSLLDHPLVRRAHKEIKDIVLDPEESFEEFQDIDKPTSNSMPSPIRKENSLPIRKKKKKSDFLVLKKDMLYKNKKTLLKRRSESQWANKTIVKRGSSNKNKDKTDHFYLKSSFFKWRQQTENGNLNFADDIKVDEELKSFIDASKKCNFSYEFISYDKFNQERNTKYRLCENSVYILLKTSSKEKWMSDKNGNKLHILFNSFLIEKDAANFNHHLLNNNLIIEGFCFSGLRNMDNEFQQSCRYLFIHSTNTLKILDLSLFNLNSKHCKIIEPLVKRCKLEEVDLSYNWNMDSGFNLLCNGLSNSANCIKRVILEGCALDEIQLRQLGKFLSQTTQLEILNLQKNRHIQLNCLDFNESLRISNNTLTNINLNGCLMDELVGETLKCLLEKCFKIQSIRISGYKWKGTLLADICQELQKSCNSLKEIEISKCDDLSLCNIALGMLLGQCRRLEKVILELNFVDGDFKRILKSLENSSKTLRILDVSRCLIDNKKQENVSSISEPNQLRNKAYQLNYSEKSKCLKDTVKH